MKWLFKWWWGMCVLIYASSAFAVHSENLQWTLPGETVENFADGFIVFHAMPNAPFLSVDVGRVPVNELGRFFHAIEVADTDNFFYVVAYNEAGSGLGSNQICRRNGVPCPIEPPPDPEPQPEPDPLHAEILGFTLWNATTDTVEMGNFISGHDFAPGCYAIEIRGNKYLRDNKGSVRKYFDGVRDGCEQKSQFGWEDDTGKLNKWNCAVSLNPIGLHTLKAEAYDSTNCSGTPQNSMEITFGVGVVPEPSFELGLFCGIATLIYLGRRHEVRLRARRRSDL